MECRKVLRMKLSEVWPGQVFSPIEESRFGRGEFIKLSRNNGTNNVLNTASWIVGCISVDTEVGVIGTVSLAELE